MREGEEGAGVGCGDALYFGDGKAESVGNVRHGGGEHGTLALLAAIRNGGKIWRICLN